MTIDIKKLQTNLAITADGLLGPDTFRALFARFGASPSIAGELGMAANVHFRVYGILNSGLRLAHFMAQVAHESGGFRYMEEIASGQAYEGRADLGNTQPGDGKRYKGRGPIQLTGRANYRSYGRRIGIDIEQHPEVVALPSFGLLVGCMYWETRSINPLADADDIEAVTRKINGGINGLAERRAYLAKAKGIIL